MDLYLVLLFCCAVAGWISGRRKMERVRHGQEEGVYRDEHGHATYYFLEDFGDNA
jgi:hypothetical protein